MKRFTTASAIMEHNNRSSGFPRLRLMIFVGSMGCLDDYGCHQTKESWHHVTRFVLMDFGPAIVLGIFGLLGPLGRFSLPVFHPANSPLLTGASRPIAKSDVPGNVIVKTGKTPKRWRLDCNKFAIAHEMTGTSVKDHDALEVQNTEGAAVGKIGARGLRIHQFYPKVLDLAGENF